MKDFLLGAVAYPLLEICWRGRTHPTMALAGGLSSALLLRLHRAHMPCGQAALLGGCAITLMEGVIGLRWNRRHQIWDYRRMPCNWRGQVCLPYTALWCLLSWAVLRFFQAAQKKLLALF